MIRELFAIRHKPSGGHLPEVGRGYTFSEPSVDRIPRLFESASAAKRALTWWLKGGTSVLRSKDYWGEYDETWQHTDIPNRKAEDMEVVPVLLKL